MERKTGKTFKTMRDDPMMGGRLDAGFRGSSAKHDAWGDTTLVVSWQWAALFKGWSQLLFKHMA